MKRTRLAFGRSRVQIPWPANLVEVFSGFLNVKIAKELVIFKDECRVGPHIPLQMYKFNVSQDMNPLLITKWSTTFEVAQQMAVKSELLKLLIPQQMTVAIRPRSQSNYK